MMKKKLFLIFILPALIIAGCSKEYSVPVIIAPEIINVETGKSIDIAFSFTAEAGYRSSTLTATGGTVDLKSDAPQGTSDGIITATFNAGRSTGAGTITITVTDNKDQISQSIAVINIESYPIVSVTGNITANTTWVTGTVYILEGRIAVTDGATLTIQPGVIVKGREGSSSNATALLIARGAKIQAVGTAEAPIIFTSVADQIIPGELGSPNLSPAMNGLWGGLIILGKAPISAAADAMQIEGIPVSDLNGLYGGNDPADNSGTLKYISIRHGGANIGEGNEINGLTLGGVGSGTVIENIEVVANQDDGTEWFGGTVNVKNLLIWNPGDDCVDTDQAWAGTLDNFIIICGDLTDHALEIDGPEGTMLAAHTIKNGSIKGNPTSELGDFRSGARGTFQDIYFFNFPDPAVAGYGDLSLSGQASLDNFAGGILNFSNLQITPATGVALTAIFKNGTSAHASSVTTRTTGADKTKFTGWTWADHNSQLTSF